MNTTDAINAAFSDKKIRISTWPAGDFVVAESIGGGNPKARRFYYVGADRARKDWTMSQAEFQSSNWEEYNPS